MSPYLSLSQNNLQNAKLLKASYTHSLDIMHAMLYYSFLYYSFISDFSLLMTGLGTPIRRGLGGISLLKWSPSGDYFFCAKLYCKLTYAI